MARNIDVTPQGLHVPSSLTGAIDVLFDGQRVWSFSVAHDGRPDGKGQSVSWPKILRRHLDGTADVELRNHATLEVLHSQTVRFGESSGRVSVVDADGNPLAVDKSGRLQRDFTHTDSSARVEIMDALERVLHNLTEECGLDAFLTYGCLLGAVRNGHMIGHDSDADLAFLSKYTHPFDVIRETTAAIRTMRSLGWKVVRMSGANFKVWVPLPDGRRCGIDVFGCFHIGDDFYFTASLGGRLDRSALIPVGTVVLEGRQIAAPARPEEVLEFAYGAGWRVPDPAFHYDLDPATIRRMEAWFRSARRRVRFWQDFYKGPDSDRVPTEPSLFARWVQQRMVDQGSGPADVLDVGAGTGRDSIYFAAQGHQVTALDFVPAGFRKTRALREKQGVKVVRRSLNLEDLRSVLVTGARLAHQPGTRQVYARGLLDTLGPTGRDNLWRFASMVQRRGGETYLEFRTPTSRDEPKFFGPHARTFVSPETVAQEIASHGGTVVHREIGRDLAPLGEENPHICRLVVRWTP
ncbi:MAG TPA: class I SAM-dependent methyltransferase [Nocardioidaceae bacterium]|nr:class I SAM-dependent methyltransferase [Nocardioidaceae bacterium]